MTAPIPVPDSPLAAAAEALVTAAAVPTLVNHSHRTYAFGALLLARRGRAVDREALFVAAMLHDLGLIADLDDGTTPFEQRGAQLAREFLQQRDASPVLAQLVSDAIALHLELGTADDPRAEVAGVSLGAAVDVLGLRLDEVPPDALDVVLSGHPRLDMTSFFVGAMRREALNKPDSRAGQYVRDLGFDAMIAAAPFAS